MLEGFHISPGLWTPTDSCFGSPGGTGGYEGEDGHLLVLLNLLLLHYWMDMLWKKDEWIDGWIIMHCGIKAKTVVQRYCVHYIQIIKQKLKRSTHWCPYKKRISRLAGPKVQWCAVLFSLSAGGIHFDVIVGLLWHFFLFVWRLSGHN